jgi:hypothetical protein
MRVASLKKFREMCEELKSDKTFKTSIEDSMTAEECACQEDEDGWASDSRPVDEGGNFQIYSPLRHVSCF